MGVGIGLEPVAHRSDPSHPAWLVKGLYEKSAANVAGVRLGDIVVGILGHPAPVQEQELGFKGRPGVIATGLSAQQMADLFKGPAGTSLELLLERTELLELPRDINTSLAPMVVILRAMDASKSENNVQVAVYNLLGYLVTHQPIAILFGATGGMDVMCRSIAAQLQNASCISLAIGVLQNLLAVKSLVSDFLAAYGVEIIVKCLINYPADGGIQKRLCCCLWYCAQSEEGATRICRVGAIRALVTALANVPGFAPEVGSTICRFVCSIMIRVDSMGMGTSIVDEGAIPKILRAVSFLNMSARQNAGELELEIAFSLLDQIAPNNLSLLRAGGAKKVLDDVLRSPTVTMSPTTKRLAKSLLVALDTLEARSDEPPLTVSGLKWLDIGANPPVHGRELFNEQLAEALQSASEFKRWEWDSFGISDLSKDDYIKSKDTYFKPLFSDAEDLNIDVHVVEVRHVPPWMKAPRFEVRVGTRNDKKVSQTVSTVQNARELRPEPYTSHTGQESLKIEMDENLKLEVQRTVWHGQLTIVLCENRQAGGEASNEASSSEYVVVFPIPKLAAASKVKGWYVLHAPGVSYVSSSHAENEAPQVKMEIAVEKVAAMPKLLTRLGSEKWREMDQKSFKAAAKKTLKAMNSQKSMRSIGGR